MEYLIIFNGHRYWEERVRPTSWVDFLRILDDLVKLHGIPPDIIYLKSLK